MVVVVSNVPEVEEANQEHGQGDVSVLLVLLGSNAEVQENPQDQSRTGLAEKLKIETANKYQ